MTAAGSLAGLHGAPDAEFFILDGFDFTIAGLLFRLSKSGHRKYRQYIHIEYQNIQYGYICCIAVGPLCASFHQSSGIPGGDSLVSEEGGCP